MKESIESLLSTACLIPWKGRKVNLNKIHEAWADKSVFWNECTMDWNKIQVISDKELSFLKNHQVRSQSDKVSPDSCQMKSDSHQLRSYSHQVTFYIHLMASYNHQVRGDIHQITSDSRPVRANTHQVKSESDHLSCYTHQERFYNYSMIVIICYLNT